MVIEIASRSDLGTDLDTHSSRLPGAPAEHTAALTVHGVEVSDEVVVEASVEVFTKDFL